MELFRASLITAVQASRVFPCSRSLSISSLSLFDDNDDDDDDDDDDDPSINGGVWSLFIADLKTALAFVVLCSTAYDCRAWLELKRAVIYGALGIGAT